MFSNNEMYYTSEETFHTNKMVQKIRNMGIKVLSYFVEDRGYGITLQILEECMVKMRTNQCYECSRDF